MIQQANIATATAKPVPFLKWAGSKRLLAPLLATFAPKRFGAYHEPFLGSGALFFQLGPRRAYLSDTCQELVDTYIAVRDNPTAVLRGLAPLSPTATQYYAIRENRSHARFKRAAEFIYLNKTCWNGLYRVNARGHFNVPYGRPTWKSAVDSAVLNACSRALGQESVSIQRADFSVVATRAKSGDLVYFDPPYVTGHTNNGFREYNDKLFSWEDQIRLAQIARRLAAGGVYVIVTNAAHPAVRALYSGFRTHLISRASTLAADVEKRGLVTEAVYITTRAVRKSANGATI